VLPENRDSVSQTQSVTETIQCPQAHGTTWLNSHVLLDTVTAGPEEPSVWPAKRPGPRSVDWSEEGPRVLRRFGRNQAMPPPRTIALQAACMACHSGSLPSCGRGIRRAGSLRLLLVWRCGWSLTAGFRPGRVLRGPGNLELGRTAGGARRGSGSVVPCQNLLSDLNRA
jgi:hypothetical protein